MLSPADHLLAQLLKSNCGPILISGPENPDGDSLGACLALQQILASRGGASDVAGDLSYRYDWFPGADRVIENAQLTDSYQTIVIMDGDRFRLTPEVDRYFKQADQTYIIDHHISTDVEGYTHAWIDTEVSSTCEMLLGALDGWNAPLNKDLATLLYAGMVFDTGGFRHSNTTSQTHEWASLLLQQGIDHDKIYSKLLMERSEAALRISGEVFQNSTFHCNRRLAIGVVTADCFEAMGLCRADLEGIVDTLLCTIGVCVAILIIQRPNRQQVKLSLRSNHMVNVCEIAHELVPSGGGHKRAAGAVFSATPEEAKARVIETVKKHLKP